MENFVVQNLFMHDSERKKCFSVLHETTCVINRGEKNSLNNFAPQFHSNQ